MIEKKTPKLGEGIPKLVDFQWDQSWGKNGEKKEEINKKKD